MEVTYLYIILFLVGSIFGSFFNVVGLRVPVRQSIIYPRSTCPKCQHTLSPVELIPIFSYIVQRGKCTQCLQPISALYPMIEGLVGLLFVWTYFHFGFQGELFIALLFLSLLTMITITDLTYQIIPNRIIFPFLLMLIILRIIHPLQPMWDSFFAAAFMFTMLTLIATFSMGGIGGGDIKLYLPIGIVLGLENAIVSLFLAALIGLVSGYVYIYYHKKAISTPIPFGPSIAIGSWIAYLYGSLFNRIFY